jgi:hypothetical protein
VTAFLFSENLRSAFALGMAEKILLFFTKDCNEQPGPTGKRPREKNSSSSLFVNLEGI